MIGVGRYGEILKRLFSIDAGDPAANFGDVSPEMSPVFVLESERPEWLFLSNQREIVAAQAVAANAGNRSVFRLRNPSTSGVLAVVKAIQLHCVAAAIEPALWLGTATTDRTTNAGALAVLDGRYNQIGITQGACIFTGDNTNAVAGTNFEVGAVPAQTSFRFLTADIVLSPGFHIDISTVALNLALTCTVRWRERELTKYEKR